MGVPTPQCLKTQPSTRAARLPPAAPARLTAGLLQGAIVQSVGAAAANPTMIAFQIPRLLIFQSAASDPRGSRTSRTVQSVRLRERVSGSELFVPSHLARTARNEKRGSPPFM